MMILVTHARGIDVLLFLFHVPAMNIIYIATVYVFLGGQVPPFIFRFPLTRSSRNTIWVVLPDETGI